MKRLHITARDRTGLFGAAIRKQAEIRRAGRGTFVRAGARRAGAARWTHVRYRGAIALKAAAAGGMDARITSPDKGDEARLLSSFLGWLDRHFGDQLASVNIEYQQSFGGSRRRPRRG